jgi:hypothetical protein
MRHSVHLLSNVTFYANKINEYPIGVNVLLPDYVLRNPGVVALITGSNGIYNDGTSTKTGTVLTRMVVP